MNRIVVRLLMAFLAVIAVTAISQLAAVVFVLVVIARGIPEASLQKVGVALQKALEAANPSSTPAESYVMMALLLASFFVAVVLAVLLARRIAAPLEGVSKAATRVALGEWNARAPLHPGEARGGSETAKLVRNFNRMAENLETLESERKATVAAIAHELRTPLTVLRGRLEAVRDGVLETTPEEFSVLISQVELLSRLVTDLRTLSLADAGQLSLERQEVDVAVLSRAVVGSFATKAAEKNLRLEVEADTPIWLNVDAERVHQVLGNLLENALRHTREGFVQLRLDSQADQVVWRVRDTGGGIPDEALPHLFERFYRAEGSRARLSGGSGLGLAIVRTIVGLHGGRVSADNHPEGGSEFTVTLPRFGQLEPLSQPVLSPKFSERPVLADPAPLEKESFFAPGTLTAALYHGLSLPLGVLYFIVLALGLSLGLGTSIIGVGLLVLFATFGFIAYAANLERWLCDALLGVPVRFAPRVKRQGFWQRFVGLVSDPMNWRALLYLLLKFPYSLAASVGVFSLAAVSVALMLAPIIRIFMKGEINIAPFSLNTTSGSFVIAGVGLLLAFLTAGLSNLLARLWAYFTRWLLEDLPVPGVAPLLPQLEAKG